MRPKLSDIRHVLRERFRLEGETLFQFDTKTKKWQKAKTRLNGKGYRVCWVRIDGIQYTPCVHRLKFFLHTGLWPDIVDHIDRDTENNSLSNLRAATRSQNVRNSRPRKKKYGLPPGVHKQRNGRYYSQISLGTFDTPEQAHEAYKRANIKLAGEFSYYA